MQHGRASRDGVNRHQPRHPRRDQRRFTPCEGAGGEVRATQGGGARSDREKALLGAASGVAPTGSAGPKAGVLGRDRVSATVEVGVVVVGELGPAAKGAPGDQDHNG